MASAGSSVPEPDSAVVAPPAVTGPNELAAAFGKELSLASRSVHADDYINNHQAVAPPLHVSTTYRYSRNPDDLKQWENHNVFLPIIISFLMSHECPR